MTADTSKTIYTIGHSIHPAAHFIAMLRSFHIQVLADIRSFPGSQRHPQFGQHALSAALQEAGMAYIHMPELGGKRKAEVTEDASIPFGGYRAYMRTEAFAAAMAGLEQLATHKRLAYMCAEADWQHCHRSLVSGYLHRHGWQVWHIAGIDKASPHPDDRLTQGNLFL